MRTLTTKVVSVSFCVGRPTANSSPNCSTNARLFANFNNGFETGFSPLDPLLRPSRNTGGARKCAPGLRFFRWSLAEFSVEIQKRRRVIRNEAELVQDIPRVLFFFDLLLNKPFELDERRKRLLVEGKFEQ